MKRVLITGVTGFVGVHLARALIDSGVAVHALTRPGARLDRIAELGGQITVHTIAPDMEAVHAAVTAAAPDTCFHLAAYFVAQHDRGDVDALAESNVAFPMRLAEAVADSDCVRLVNVGTAWQHVGGAEYRPKSLYAATKQAFDDVLAFYAWSGRLDVVTLRLFDTYGPGDTRGKVVSALLRAAATGEALAMGSGSPLLDLVHVDDVVEALLVAARLPVTRKAPPARYSVSSGRPLSVRDLADLVGKVYGREVPTRWGTRADRADEMLAPWDAGPPLPGWAPRIALEDGLRTLLPVEP